MRQAHENRPLGSAEAGVVGVSGVRETDHLHARKETATRSARSNRIDVAHRSDRTGDEVVALGNRFLHETTPPHSA